MGEFESSKRSKKVEQSKTTTSAKRAASFREVKPTKIIRYRMSPWQVITMAFFITLSFCMGIFILYDVLTRQKDTQDTEPETVVMSSTEGAVLNSEYGHFYLLKTGILYYVPNSGMEFEASMLPGVSGRYIIQESEIDDFRMPASVVGGKTMTTGYVFDGYKVDVNNIETIEELKTDTIIGSRSFRIKTATAEEYLLVVTLGDVQRKIVYDETEVEVEIETEEKVPIGKDETEADEDEDEEEDLLPAVAQDNEAAEQLGNQALADAEAEAEAEFDTIIKKEVQTVKKRTPRIQVSYGPAKAQLIKLQ